MERLGVSERALSEVLPIWLMRFLTESASGNTNSCIISFVRTEGDAGLKGRSIHSQTTF